MMRTPTLATSVEGTLDIAAQTEEDGSRRPSSWFADGRCWLVVVVFVLVVLAVPVRVIRALLPGAVVLVLVVAAVLV